MLYRGATERWCSEPVSRPNRRSTSRRCRERTWSLLLTVVGLQCPLTHCGSPTCCERYSPNYGGAPHGSWTEQALISPPLDQLRGVLFHTRRVFTPRTARSLRTMSASGLKPSATRDCQPRCKCAVSLSD